MSVIGTSQSDKPRINRTLENHEATSLLVNNVSKFKVPTPTPQKNIQKIQSKTVTDETSSTTKPSRVFAAIFSIASIPIIFLMSCGYALFSKVSSLFSNEKGE